MKQNKNIFILIFIFILCTAILAAGAIFANDDSHRYSQIKFELNNITAGTKVFNFDTADGNYYKNILFSGTSNTVTVQKKAPTGTYYVDSDNEFVNYFRYNNVTAYDLLVFTNVLNRDANFVISGYVANKYQTSEGACTIFSNISYEGGEGTSPHNLTLESNIPDISVKIVVLTYTNVNTYIKNNFDLKMSNNEKMHNFYYDTEGPMTNQTYFKFVYFIDDIVLKENFTLNYPSYINLLHSNIILNDNITFEIKHHERGVFAIESITGKINNSASDSVFSINCPNAYYRSIATQATWWTGVVSDVNTLKFKQISDITIADDSIVRGYLLQDSLYFVKDSLPLPEETNPSQIKYNIIQGITLPTNYHKYDISYNYKILTTQSVLSLKEDYTLMLNRDAFDTVVEMEITATLNYLAYGSVQTQTEKTTVYLNVVGNNRSSFLDMLSVVFESYRIKTGIYDSEDDIYKLANSLDIAKIVLDYTTIFYEQNNTIPKYDFVIEIAEGRINLDFEYSKERYRHLYFKYDNTYNCYAVTLDKDSLTYVPLKKYVGLGGNDWNYEYIEIYINPQNLLLEYADEMLTLSIELEDATIYSRDIKFTIDGITLEEQMAYLERYIETLFFSSSSDVLKTLRVDTSKNGIYKGPIEDDNEVIPYTFGFEEVIYTVYRVDKATLNSYFSQEINVEELLQHSDLYASEVFDIDEGTLKAGLGIILRVDDMYALFVKMEFVYPDDVDIDNYQTIRELILPTSGFGDDELYEYIKGNTFGPYFSGAEPVDESAGVTKIVDGKLINSTKDVWQSGGYGGLSSPYPYVELQKKLNESANKIVTMPVGAGIPLPTRVQHLDAGTAYRFKPKIETVRLTMDIYVPGEDDDDIGVRNAALAEKADIYEYCKIMETQFTSIGENYWQIDINVDNIPSTNSHIQVKATFYVIRQIVGEGGEATEQEEAISEQYYSFIIPGIYRLGNVGSEAEFYDEFLYNYLVLSETYDSFRGYLIADSCKNKAVELDLSYGTIFSYFNALDLWDPFKSILNLKGINLLEGATAMNFNGWQIESLEPFTKFTTYNLKKLNLSQCNITDDIIKANSLYSLNNLIELNLDHNNLTTFLDDSGNPLFYRTVKKLLLYNNDFVDLKGISTLSQLEELDVGGNKIRSFSAILDVPTLKKLYVGGNVGGVEEFSHVGDANVYYGTTGKINIPLYVMFIERGMEIYAFENDLLEYTEHANDYCPITIEGLTEIPGLEPFISKEEYYAALIVNSMFVFKTQYNFAWFYKEISVFTNLPSLEKYDIDYTYIVQNNISLGVITENEVPSGSPENGPYDNIVMLTPEITLVSGEFKLIISIEYGVGEDAITMYREFDLIFHS